MNVSPSRCNNSTSLFAGISSFDDDGTSVATDAKTEIFHNCSTEDENDENPIHISTKGAFGIDSCQQDQVPLTTILQIEDNGELKAPKSHTWSQPGGQIHKVRGMKYLDDGIKVDSMEQIFQTRGVDFFLTDEFGPCNIGR